MSEAAPGGLWGGGAGSREARVKTWDLARAKSNSTLCIGAAYVTYWGLLLFARLLPGPFDLQTIGVAPNQATIYGGSILCLAHRYVGQTCPRAHPISGFTASLERTHVSNYAKRSSLVIPWASQRKQVGSACPKVMARPLWARVGEISWPRPGRRRFRNVQWRSFDWGSTLSSF